MKHIVAFLSITGSLLLTACNADMEIEQERGGLMVSLVEEGVEVSSRATPTEIGSPQPEQFTLKITKDDTKYVIYNGNYKTGTFYTFAGIYTLETSYGDNPILEWDSPYYAGATSAEVFDGRITTAQIPVSVQNALVSAKFTNQEMFRQLYKDYGLEVKVTETSGDAIAMTITPDVTERSLYFRAGSDITISFVGTTTSGTKVKHPLNEALADRLPLKAAEHVIISLAASNVGVSITKIDINHVTIPETIPQNWLPKPKASSNEFSDNALTMVETESKAASVDFTVASPIQEATVTLNLNAPQFPELMNHNGTYTLSSLTAEQRTALQGIGITVPNIGESSCKFDFSGLTSLLQTDNGETTANIISLDVKANDRWASSGTETPGTATAYTIHVNKPTFSVSALPEHMWSKEFTVEETQVTAGNANKIKENLTYQYSMDGVTWYDCNDTRRHKFATHPDIKNYKVRACYRGAVASSNTADVTLESLDQIPNSSLDEWTDDNYQGSRYSFNPWTTKGECHWDTNNLFTTRHRTNSSSATMANYNGYHAVSYVPGRNGLAAEVRSTANGKANTRWDFIVVSHKEQDYNKVAGELFVGTASVTTGWNDADASSDALTKTKDGVFNTRPTAIKLWYKYAPHNTDTWTGYVELLDENKNIIIQKMFSSSTSQSGWTEATINLDYVDGQVYKKCKYIYVLFCSTNNPGANMGYSEKTHTFYYNQGNNTMSFKPAYIGSILTIDDISLVYDK